MDIDKKTAEMERVAKTVIVRPGLANIVISGYADQAEIEYFKGHQPEKLDNTTFVDWLISEEFAANAPTIRMVIDYVGGNAPFRKLTAVAPEEFDFLLRTYEADALGFCLFEVELEMGGR